MHTIIVLIAFLLIVGSLVKCQVDDDKIGLRMDIDTGLVPKNNAQDLYMKLSSPQHSVVLCNKRIDSAVNGKIPCEIPKKYIRKGHNDYRVTIYSQATGKIFAYMDASFDTNERSAVVGIPPPGFPRDMRTVLFPLASASLVTIAAAIASLNHEKISPHFKRFLKGDPSTGDANTIPPPLPLPSAIPHYKHKGPKVASKVGYSLLGCGAVVASVLGGLKVRANEYQEPVGSSPVSGFDEYVDPTLAMYDFSAQQTSALRDITKKMWSLLIQVVMKSGFIDGLVKEIQL